jgi:hypothetical protein
MPTRPSKLTLEAFRWARQELAKTPGFCDLDGFCIDASVMMHKYLRDHGVRARLVRYELPTGEGGHWTIETSEGEFDPTVGCWKLRGVGEEPRPRGARCDALYPVTESSPHRRRWRRTRVVERTAYETVFGTQHRWFHD